MSSLIQDIQRQAASKDGDLTELLRKSLIAGRKLGLSDFEEWVQKELHGYSFEETSPEYRYVTGEIKAFNPYNGVWCPLIWTSQKPESMKRRGVKQKVAELEDLSQKGDESGVLYIPFSENLTYKLMESSDLPFPPKFVVQKTALQGILQSVRDQALEWSLRLEEQGIKGEGMSFSTAERERAQENRQVSIRNFQGILGNVSGSDVFLARISHGKSGLWQNHPWERGQWALLRFGT